MSQKDERVKNIQRINELEAKCASYDEEMNRLKKHCFELEEQGRQVRSCYNDKKSVTEES